MSKEISEMESKSCLKQTSINSFFTKKENHQKEDQKKEDHVQIIKEESKIIRRIKPCPQRFKDSNKDVSVVVLAKPCPKRFRRPSLQDENHQGSQQQQKAKKIKIENEKMEATKVILLPKITKRVKPQEEAEEKEEPEVLDREVEQVVSKVPKDIELATKEKTTNSSNVVGSLAIGGETFLVTDQAALVDPKLKMKTVVKVEKFKTEEYEVEKILDYTWSKVKDQGLYFIKWLDWEEKHNTWEPAYNLNCPDKLKDFYMERMSAREKATPAEKRSLQVPPDPRTHFEKINNFVDKIFSPPCYADLEKFFLQYRNNPNPPKEWTVVALNKTLDKLSKMKKMNETLLEQVKEQLMLKFMLEGRNEQSKRLKEWATEINQYEDVKILVQNDADLEGPPRHMSYITKYKPSDGIVISDDPPIGCECGDACDVKNEENCCPGHNNTLFPYDRWGRLRIDVGVAIFECNKKCTCGQDCKSKVVQKGRKTKLCIFRTDNGCGWGVKAMEKIKCGSFVVEYVGEVIRNEEAEERGKKYDAEGRTYLFDLDFNRGNEENLYTVDAAHYGNVAHFINHSCDPNLSIFNVWIDCLDPDLPRLCLFARRDIAKGEQITFDYCQQSTQNYEFLDVEGSSSNVTNAPDDGRKRSECRCGARKCRKWLFD